MEVLATQQNIHTEGETLVDEKYAYFIQTLYAI
jgi:hypothetical protein